jgi:hypothetical protein
MMGQIDDFLTKASVKGYRTLLMAMRLLDKDEVDKFLKDCETIEKNLETREKKL